MSIEITGNPGVPVPANGTSAGADVKSINPDQSHAAGQTTQPTDSVTITSSALNMQSAEQKMKDVPVVDKDRVERIRSAIKSGEYAIDPVKIADKFVSLESSLYS
jgi:negative regulator of flagellin synthesis FlgM